MRMYDQCFRELGILIATILVAIVLLSCSGSVRDSEVYSAEVNFMEAAATEQVERGMAMIDEYCVCDEVLGVRGFTSEECQNLAETILVVQYRMKYHLLFMEYLGGLHEKRPPKEPPEIPDVSSLCPKAEKGISEPQPIPDELDYGGDAGVDAGE